MENSQKDTAGTPSDDPRSSAAPSTAVAAGVARRRLIKAGAAAVPVAATLVSRPAFAWHGKTPSAWGSEQLNPNTSLAAVHTAYADEVWSIQNWIDNSSRAGFGNTWDTLVAAYPAIKTASNCVNGVFDYRKVTVKELSAVPGLTIPPGVVSTVQVASAMASYRSTFQVAIVVAQLNHILLSGKIPDLKNIVSLTSLQQMATGQFRPNTSGQQTNWTSATTLLYLQQNWLAV